MYGRASYRHAAYAARANGNGSAPRKRQRIQDVRAQPWRRSPAAFHAAATVSRRACTPRGGRPARGHGESRPMDEMRRRRRCMRDRPSSIPSAFWAPFVRPRGARGPGAAEQQRDTSQTSVPHLCYVDGPPRRPVAFAPSPRQQTRLPNRGPHGESVDGHMRARCGTARVAVSCGGQHAPAAGPRGGCGASGPTGRAFVLAPQRGRPADGHHYRRVWCGHRGPRSCALCPAMERV